MTKKKKQPALAGKGGGVNVEMKSEDGGGESGEGVPVCLEQFSPISSTVNPFCLGKLQRCLPVCLPASFPGRVTGRDSEKAWQKWPNNVPVQREKIPRYCSTKTCFFLRGSKNISEV